MHTTSKSIFRAAVTAAAVFGLGASALTAAGSRFSGYFYCYPQTTWDFANVPGVGMVPATCHVTVPGAGYVSNMDGAVVCYTTDETINLLTGQGSATFTLRDTTGDMIVLRMDAMNMDPTPATGHTFSFRGTYRVASGTGRFAGATGAGVFDGWANAAAPTAAGAMPATGLGFWEFEGSINLAASQTAAPLHLSSRARVGSGVETQILGFEVKGSAAKTFLIRGVGPTLANYGVTGALADPIINVTNAAGQTIATNDNWSVQTGTPAGSLSDIAARVGAFALPAGSKDSALLLTLDPGSYTVSLSAVGGGTGIGLIEVYEVQ